MLKLHLTEVQGSKFVRRYLSHNINTNVAKMLSLLFLSIIYISLFLIFAWFWSKVSVMFCEYILKLNFGVSLLYKNQNEVFPFFNSGSTLVAIERIWDAEESDKSYKLNKVIFNCICFSCLTSAYLIL